MKTMLPCICTFLHFRDSSFNFFTPHGWSSWCQCGFIGDLFFCSDQLHLAPYADLEGQNTDRIVVPSGYFSGLHGFSTRRRSHGTILPIGLQVGQVSDWAPSRLPKSGKEEHSSAGLHEISSDFFCIQCKLYFGSSEDLNTHTSKFHSSPTSIAKASVGSRKSDQRRGCIFLSERRRAKGGSWSKDLSGIGSGALDSSQKKFRCSVCGVQFSHHHSLLRHKWKCEGTRNFVCDKCGHVTYRSDHHKLHLNTQHDINKKQLFWQTHLW